MTLLSPLALALTLVGVPILLMYMLRIHRREREVSSTFLWQRSFEDIQTNPRWRRIRPNLLLFLQLLILAALVLALAQPAYTRNRTFNGDVIAVIDQSLGMQASDVAPTRLAAALQRARQMAADLPDGSVMSVIGMGAQPRLVIAESGDQTALDRAINGLSGTVSSPPSYAAALTLAASLARRGAHTQIVVLTSRDSGIGGVTIPLQVPVEIDRIGGTIHDLGITAFRATHFGGATQASLTVHNFGPGTARSDLELYADGQLADVRPVTLRAHAQLSETWSSLPSRVLQLRAQLAAHDDLSTDKTAWAVVPQPVTNRVLLVTPGDFFLKTALSLAPGVKLTTLSPVAYQPSAALGSDLVVFDGTLPRSIPAGPVLLVNPPRGAVAGLHIGSERPVAAISVVPGLSGGPASLLQYVDLSDVHVARARLITLPAWMQPVVTSTRAHGGQSIPLVAVGDEGGRRVGVVAFSLEESDWPLRLSFPVAVQNLLTFLEPGLGIASSRFDTGQPVTLYPGPGTRQIRIRRPDGRVDVLYPPFLPFSDTSQPGLYRAEEVSVGGTRSLTFAVNAFGTRLAESATSAATGPDVLQFGRQSVGSSSSPVPVNLAWACGLAALALLGAEWWYGFRR